MKIRYLTEAEMRHTSTDDLKRHKELHEAVVKAVTAVLNEWRKRREDEDLAATVLEPTSTELVAKCQQAITRSAKQVQLAWNVLDGRRSAATT